MTSPLTPFVSVYSALSNNPSDWHTHFPSTFTRYSVFYPSFSVMVTIFVVLPQDTVARRGTSDAVCLACYLFRRS